MLADGGDTLVTYGSEESPHVTALDGDGKELWTIEPDHTAWLYDFAPDSDVFVMRSHDTGAGIEARSTADGGFAWWHEDGDIAAVTEAGVLFTGEGDAGEDGEDAEGPADFGLLDSETGEEIWRSQADSWQLQGDTVYLTDGDTVRRLDLSSGDEKWSITADVDLDPDDPVLTVAAAEDMAVVAGQDEAVALSASDGGELWHESLGDDGSGPFQATSNVVYLETDVDSEADKDGEVRFFDRDGEVASLPVDVDDYGFSSSRSTSAERRTSSTATPGSCTTRTSTSWVTTPAGCWRWTPGLYSSDEGDLEYYEIGESSPVWSIPVDDDDEDLWFTAVDDGVLVVAGDRVVRYE